MLISDSFVGLPLIFIVALTPTYYANPCATWDSEIVKNIDYNVTEVCRIAIQNLRGTFVHSVTPCLPVGRQGKVHFSPRIH